MPRFSYTNLATGHCLRAEIPNYPMVLKRDLKVGPGPPLNWDFWDRPWSLMTLRVQGQVLARANLVAQATKRLQPDFSLQINGLEQQFADLSTQMLNLDAKYSQELGDFGQQLQELRQQLLHNHHFFLALSGTEAVPREADQSLLNSPPALRPKLEVNVIDVCNLMKFYSVKGDESFSEFIHKFEDFANQQPTVSQHISEAGTPGGRRYQ